VEKALNVHVFQKETKVVEQSAFFGDTDSSLPSFASAAEEIKRAVERNAVQRGILLVKVLVSLNMDEAIATVESIATEYDKEEIHEASGSLGIDAAASDSTRPSQSADSVSLLFLHSSLPDGTSSACNVLSQCRDALT